MVKIVKPSAIIMSCTGGSYEAMLELVTDAGLNCYKEERGKLDNDDTAIVKKIMRMGHESVLEHASITVRIICDRGVTHELVRHRLAAYSQESTRYCDYTNEKFGGEITVILPLWFEENPNNFEYVHWVQAMERAEQAYIEFVKDFDWTAQQARSVLPNSLKTEIVTTFNIRTWRWVLSQRTSQNPRAHPQMREIMDIVHEQLKEAYPVFFEELPHQKGEMFEK